MLTIPFNVWIENIAVLWGMLGDKNGFYVVKKDVQLLNEHDGLPCWSRSSSLFFEIWVLSSYKVE